MQQLIMVKNEEAAVEWKEPAANGVPVGGYEVSFRPAGKSNNINDWLVVGNMPPGGHMQLST